MGGRTNVHINGATLIGGAGSKRGVAIDIAEAEVTIHSAIVDGRVLVAKRGSLNVHGGKFTDGGIEVWGDGSLVTFYGCFDKDDMIRDEDENSVSWSFAFLGDDSRIGVLVHEGGNIIWDEIDQ